jgi:hypothetical protein
MKGRAPMATATAPRNDIYLTVLAGRAVTALADLSSDPSAWSERIGNGLQDGIVYCQAVRARAGRDLGSGSSEGKSALRRSVGSTSGADSVPTDVCVESERIERFLSQLASRKHRPKVPELVDAIEFLRKTATDR